MCRLLGPPQLISPGISAWPLGRSKRGGGTGKEESCRDSRLVMGYPAYDIFHTAGFDLRIVDIPISFQPEFFCR
jgi:hypothetical protein